MAATKKQSPAKAAAAKRAEETSSPEPELSTRASPRKASAAKAKKAPSPVKKAASPVKKATSPAKKSASPAKKSASPAKQAASPARRAASPAKRAASPNKKAGSPTKKSATPDPTMRRSTRKTDTASPSVTPVGSKSKPTKSKPTKVTSKAIAEAKRGLLDEDDDADDSTEMLDEIVAEVDRRKLTKWDKMMTSLLQQSDQGVIIEPEGVLDIFAEEVRLADLGQPLNCHAKIYWRFRHTFPDLADEAARDGESAHQSIEQPDSPRKSSAKSVGVKRHHSKSPAKSPKRAPRKLVPMTRPMRRRSTSSDPFEAGAKFHRDIEDEYNDLIGDGNAYSSYVIAVEQEAYESVQADLPSLSNPPENIRIELDDYELAWERGCRRAYREKGFAPRNSGAQTSSDPPIVRARMASTLTQTQTDAILAQSVNRPRGPSMFDSPGKKLGTGPKLSPGKASTSASSDLGRMTIRSPAAPVKALAGARSPTASPGKASAMRSSSGAPSSRPAIAPMPKQDPRRGPVVSTTNPPFLPGTSKPNPFFETMPAPEVWHRRYPSFFSFGETPYMEQVMSDQINEDLARKHDDDDDEESSASTPPPSSGPSPAAAPTLMSRIGSALLGRSGSASAAPEGAAAASNKKGKSRAKPGVHDRVMEAKPLRPTMWALPNLSQEEFFRFMSGKPIRSTAAKRRRSSGALVGGGGAAKKRSR